VTLCGLAPTLFFFNLDAQSLFLFLVLRSFSRY
jgi:hypothetical protein